MLVDDCNYSHVRAATYDFCDLRPEWALLFERYTEGHPLRVSDDLRERMQEGWWNGVHVLVHHPRYLVDRLPRPDEPELDRFFLAQHPAENCQTDYVGSRLARARVLRSRGSSAAQRRCPGHDDSSGRSRHLLACHLREQRPKVPEGPESHTRLSEIDGQAR